MAMKITYETLKNKLETGQVAIESIESAVIIEENKIQGIESRDYSGGDWMDGQIADERADDLLEIQKHRANIAVLKRILQENNRCSAVETEQPGVPIAASAKTPVHRTAAGQAIELLNRQTPQQHEQWNAAQMEKIRRNEEANRRADNRRRGIANDEPTYENGIQEWDD